MRRPVLVACAAVILIASTAAGCGTSSDRAGDGAGDSRSTAAPSSASSGLPGTGGDSGPSSSGTGQSSPSPTPTPSTSESASTTRDPFAGENDGPRTAPSTGRGTALLTKVRVGRNAGFERIVFEFRGTVLPSYRIRYTNGPITAEGSGEAVEVKGAAKLEVIMQPASGVDVEGSGKPTYTGPDRLPLRGGGDLIRDLVRTGDFEAVLTWVAGLGARVPFKVSTLSSPARIVVDLKAR